jgi:CO/xanthine dehydrogenase FAD-binding subunit
MRSYLPSYELRRPQDLAEALHMLAGEPGVWRPLAGGTDVMVMLEAGLLAHERYISLWGIPELRGMEVSEAAISVGALTTYSDLLKHPLVQAEFPLLCDAARETGGVATQNRGTVGGNIGNASPAADTPPALLAYDAELELLSARGVRRMPYERFHTGYKTSHLAADELIARIHLPRGRRGWRETYRKVGTRKAQAIAKVCFAAAARIDGDVVQDIRLAFGSVAPTVVRATAAEQALRGARLDADSVKAAATALGTDIAPIDDIRSTARYRALVARQLLVAFLQSPGSSDKIP